MVLPGVGDRLFLAREAQAELALGVGRGGPAHERLDPSRRIGLELKRPAPGAGVAGLHGRLGRAEDTDLHDVLALPSGIPFGRPPSGRAPTRTANDAWPRGPRQGEAWSSQGSSQGPSQESIQGSSRLSMFHKANLNLVVF